MDRDEHGFENARIQYQLDISQPMPICPASHVCFKTIKRLPHQKRIKYDGPDIPFTTANARECDKAKISVVGVSISDNINPDVIKRHPLAAGRVTVQCAGIVDLVAPKLHRSIQIGDYVCVDPDAPIQQLQGLPQEFGIFELKKVGFMTKREHVIGRVCHIRLATYGNFIIRVLLTLQPPSSNISIPIASTFTEDSIFETYIPPTLLHTLWNEVTPPNMEDQTNAQSQKMLSQLQTLREDALKSNSALANMLERAINEVEFTEAPSITFPRFHDMSIMGIYAFLVGTKDTKGILWYSESLEDARNIAMNILLLMPESGGRPDYITSTAYKSDSEYALFERFQMWTKRHYQHTYEPLIKSIRTCIIQATAIYEGSA